MKRSVVMTWSLVVFMALLFIAGGLWLVGWRPNFDCSVVLSERFGKVENGSAFDRAAVDLGNARKVVLPHDVVVRRTSAATEVRLFMKKTLAFGGHPPERMSIRDARKNMGCAGKSEGDALLVATYGEWDSRIEGGADMKLVVVVPEDVEVEQRKGLSGPDSAGQEWHGQYLTRPKAAHGGWWYGPASPADGWTAVPDVPDADRTAGEVQVRTSQFLEGAERLTLPQHTFCFCMPKQCRPCPANL
jgi:hypothetical protein